MKIETYVKKETDVKTINIYIKVRDEFCGDIKNTEGETVCEFGDIYVPGFFPGEHYGDYLDLNIDLATGQILNWKKPTNEQLKEFIKENQVEE